MLRVFVDRGGGIELLQPERDTWLELDESSGSAVLYLTGSAYCTVEDPDVAGARRIGARETVRITVTFEEPPFYSVDGGPARTTWDNEEIARVLTSVMPKDDPELGFGVGVGPDDAERTLRVAGAEGGDGGVRCRVVFHLPGIVHISVEHHFPFERTVWQDSPQPEPGRTRDRDREQALRARLTIAAHVDRITTGWGDSEDMGDLEMRIFNSTLAHQPFNDFRRGAICGAQLNKPRDLLGSGAVDAVSCGNEGVAFLCATVGGSGVSSYPAAAGFRGAFRSYCTSGTQPGLSIPDMRRSLLSYVGTWQDPIRLPAGVAGYVDAHAQTLEWTAFGETLLWYSRSAGSCNAVPLPSPAQLVLGSPVFLFREAAGAEVNYSHELRSGDLVVAGTDCIADTGPKEGYAEYLFRPCSLDPPYEPPAEAELFGREAINRIVTGVMQQQAHVVPWDTPPHDMALRLDYSEYTGGASVIVRALAAAETLYRCRPAEGNDTLRVHEQELAFLKSTSAIGDYIVGEEPDSGTGLREVELRNTRVHEQMGDIGVLAIELHREAR